MGGGVSSDQPFTLEKVCFTAETPVKYTVYDAIRVVDGEEFSVFAIESGSTEMGITLSENFLRNWKMYRYPVLAPFIDSYEALGITHVVTDRLRPFDAASLTENELAWSFHSLTRLVAFLNEYAGVVHGNLVEGALFLTNGRELKVSGLFWLCSVENDNSVIRKFRGEWERGLGSVAPVIDATMDATFVKALGNAWKKGLPKAVTRIANRASVLEDRYWENDGYVQYLEVLRELPLRSTQEREEFFRGLLQGLAKFAVETQTWTILPALISALTFAPTPALLGTILTIGRNLTEERFGRIVVPPLVGLLGSNDRVLKAHLLNEIDALVPFLDANIVNEQIFGNVVTGLSDLTVQLRHATIVAMSQLAQFLSRDNMTTLMYNLKRVQTDGEPQIRANSVICVAKIAAYIVPETRGQSICNYFAKAAADSHVSVRKASLVAFRNCKKYFENGTIASVAMPAVAPMCADADMEVREGAMRTMEAFMEILRGRMPQSPVKQEMVMTSAEIPVKEVHVQEERKNVRNQDVSTRLTTGTRKDVRTVEAVASTVEGINTSASQKKANDDKESVRVVQKKASPVVEQKHVSVVDRKPAPVKQLHDVTEEFDGWDSDVSLGNEDDEVSPYEKTVVQTKSNENMPTSQKKVELPQKQALPSFDDDDGVNGWSDVDLDDEGDNGSEDVNFGGDDDGKHMIPDANVGRSHVDGWDEFDEPEGHHSDARTSGGVDERSPKRPAPVVKTGRAIPAKALERIKRNKYD